MSFHRFAPCSAALVINPARSECSGINSPPITYTHQGRQYVTVLSGVGGVLNRTMKAADAVPTGGSVWTFALMPE
jgi:alcohol dehydrogenase (cytochrome c)